LGEERREGLTDEELLGLKDVVLKSPPIKSRSLDALIFVVECDGKEYRIGVIGKEAYEAVKKHGYKDAQGRIHLKVPASALREKGAGWISEPRAWRWRSTSGWLRARVLSLMARRVEASFSELVRELNAHPVEVGVEVAKLVAEGTLADLGRGLLRYRSRWTAEEVKRMFTRRARLGPMFPFVDSTWNPVKGCHHACCYCYRVKYGGEGKPRLIEDAFKRRFKPGAFVFACDLSDLFAEGVPREWVVRVLEVVRAHPETLFLLLTKNPRRYNEFVDIMPHNVVLGATVETDLDHVASELSQAPPPSTRLEAMRGLEWPFKFISVEPVLRFSRRFSERIAECEPIAVAVGYDNHGHGLPEPSMEEVEGLIEELEGEGIVVVRKTIRPAWWEIRYHVEMGA